MGFVGLDVESQKRFILQPLSEWAGQGSNLRPWD